MECLSVTVSRFRNIEEERVAFSPGVNVLCGQNAQGKTNLLEAIYFAAIGKSFRGQHPREVIAFGEDAAGISLDFKRGGRNQNITMRLFQNRARVVEKNRVRVTKMSELVGSFRAVLFCPEHLSLIKGGPSERRQFLDIAISGLEPAYLGALQRYAHVLKQRNALIRNAVRDRESFLSTVEFWSRQLAVEGAYIARSRCRYVNCAKGFVAEYFKEMTGEREIPALLYCGPDKREGSDYENIEEITEILFSQLSSNYEREIGAGATLYGIHKDDVDVMLNGKSARLYASQGQQRSLSLALKLSEGDLCHKDCGEYPVFLFDDVLSELDASRKQYLLSKIKDKQVILTTCEDFEDMNCCRIAVSGGKFRQL